MSLEDKIKATAKDAEGKLQAAAGELTGDEKMKLKGEAKQVQAKMMDASENLKDAAANAADAVGDSLRGKTGKP